MSARNRLTSTVIVIQANGTDYHEFAGNAFFVGVRFDLGHVFHGLLADDDDEVTELARSLDCRAIYYEVPVAEVAAFIQGYGTGDEPVRLLSPMRQRFETAPGPSARSRLVTYSLI